MASYYLSAQISQKLVTRNTELAVLLLLLKLLQTTTCRVCLQQLLGMQLTGVIMIEYATITSGSVMGHLTDNLYKLTQWFGGLPTYWIVGSVVLFFLLLHFLVKKV